MHSFSVKREGGMYKYLLKYEFYQHRNRESS